MLGVTFQSTRLLTPAHCKTLQFRLVSTVCISNICAATKFYSSRPQRPGQTGRRKPNTKATNRHSREASPRESCERESSTSEPAGPTVTSQETVLRPDLSGYVRKKLNPTDEPGGTNRISHESLPSARLRPGIQPLQPKWQLMTANDRKAKFPGSPRRRRRPGHQATRFGDIALARKQPAPDQVLLPDGH